MIFEDWWEWLVKNAFTKDISENQLKRYKAVALAAWKASCVSMGKYFDDNFKDKPEEYVCLRCNAKKK
jgi:hypothetical protein